MPGCNLKEQRACPIYATEKTQLHCSKRARRLEHAFSSVSNPWRHKSELSNWPVGRQASCTLLLGVRHSSSLGTKFCPARWRTQTRAFSVVSSFSWAGGCARCCLRIVLNEVGKDYGQRVLLSVSSALIDCCAVFLSQNPGFQPHWTATQECGHFTHLHRNPTAVTMICRCSVRTLSSAFFHIRREEDSDQSSA